MSRRTLIIAGLSATFAFAGGYALLDSMQPATTRTQVVSSTPAVTKVVATQGTALVPVGNGTDEWMLIAADGTVLAGPDGRPPSATDGSGPAAVQEGDYRQDNDGGRDYEEHEDDDHDSDRKHHDDDDDDDDHHDHDDRYSMQATGTSSKSAEKARARSRR